MNGPIKAITSTSSSNADVHVYLCKDNQDKDIGIARKSSLCKTTWVGDNNALIEKQENVLTTALVNGYFIFFIIDLCKQNTFFSLWLMKLATPWECPMMGILEQHAMVE